MAMINRKSKFIVSVLIIIFCLFVVEVTEIQSQDTILEKEQSCPANSLFEPSSGICATINDKTHLFIKGKKVLSIQSIPSLTQLRKKKALKRRLKSNGAPVPGGNGGGISYKRGSLQALEHAELHTKMFVYPSGWNPSFHVDWLFTPATNRMDNPVELVGIYARHLNDRGVLGLFGRSCSEDYPCPNGEMTAGWQWFIDFSDLPCNLEEIVDNGGHIQTIIQYSNTTEKLDQQSPPLWRNAVYLWNYCAENWDLVYEHYYRENKKDCSIEGCAWWGPLLETFGDEQPEINELGFEDTLLYHDGIWSELTPSETNFKNPISPWILSHLDPNRGFGAGNYFVIADSVDSDSDGIPDDEDECPNSDLNETVIIDGCDSEVENVIFDDGCTISDLIWQCAEDAKNHGQFASRVSHLTNYLKKDDAISGKDKGKIQKCAAKADIP